MDKLSETLAKNADRLADAISALGPDAARVYGEMVGWAAVQSWIWVGIAATLLVVGAAFVRFVFADARKSEFEDGDFVAVCLGLCLVFVGVLVLGAHLPNALYPEAAVIREFLH